MTGTAELVMLSGVESKSKFSGAVPAGRRGTIAPTDPLPVQDTTELPMPVDRLWQAFLEVERWPEWNPCIWRARVKEGELREGATLVWTFNAIKPRYPYKLPARAEIVEFVPYDRVTWEVSAPGFHALHSYRFEMVGPDACRFGSWEVAEGPAYRALRRFWLAHFRYVCRASLEGAAALARTTD
jgi:hypothetical protein